MGEKNYILEKAYFKLLPVHQRLIGLKKILLSGLLFCLLFFSALAENVSVKDVFVSSIQLSTEKALLVGGTQTATVTIENTSGNPATGNIKIEIVGPNSDNSKSYELVDQEFPIGGKTFTVTFGLGTVVPIPFDKGGVYKVVAEVSNVVNAASDPIKHNNSSEAFFFVATEKQNPIPETGFMAIALIITTILYITCSRGQK